MFSSIRTPLLIAAIAGVMALLSPAAYAEITITRAEVQWGDAVVNGRGAAANETIYWRDDPGDVEFDVTTANKRGKFSIQGAVPSDCEGALSTDSYTGPIVVELDNCIPDSGEPEPPSGLLVEEWAQSEAHNGDAVRAVGFASDGKGGTWVISGGEDAYLRTWDLQNLAPTEEDDQELSHTIYDLESSADGSFVVTGEGGWNGGPGSDTLRILDADSILEGVTAPIGFVYCVAISPDSQWIVASGFYGDIVVYGPYSLELLMTKNTKKKRTKALAFSPDGNVLASTSTAGRIQLRSFPDLDLLPVSMSHGGSWAFPIAFAPYSGAGLTEIVSGSDGGTIKVWTINLTEEPPDVSVVPIPSGAVYALDWWSPEEPTEDSMIVAAGEGTITVYDAASTAILFQAVNAHAGRVNDVAFSPDGTMIASGGADGAVKLWTFGTP